MRIIVNRDESYVYQNDRWGQSLSPNQPDSTVDPLSFGDWVKQFLDALPPSDPKFGATQRGIVDEFYNYLWAYWSWGNQGFPGIDESGGSSAAPQNPYFKTVFDAQGRMAAYTYNLVH